MFTDVNRTLAGVIFDNGSASYDVSGQGAVRFANVSSTPAINVDSGMHEFQAGGGLNSNTTVDVPNGSTLSFNNRWNLNSNTLTKTCLGTVAINNDLLFGNRGTLD